MGAMKGEMRKFEDLSLVEGDSNTEEKAGHTECKSSGSQLQAD